MAGEGNSSNLTGRTYSKAYVQHIHKQHTACKLQAEGIRWYLLKCIGSHAGNDRRSSGLKYLLTRGISGTNLIYRYIQQPRMLEYILSICESWYYARGYYLEDQKKVYIDPSYIFWLICEEGITKNDTPSLLGGLD